MKNLIFVLFLGLSFVGCKEIQQVVEQPYQQQEPQQLQSEKLEVWKQSIYPPISVADSVEFINSKEITLNGDFLNQVFMIVDGGIQRNDSILEVLKTVPIYTPGGALLMKKDNNGQILEMNTYHDRNDATYQFNWRRKTDESFTLNGNALLIYNGKSYKVNAATKNGECILLVKFTVNTVVQTVKEQAEGINFSGTKVVKVNKK